MLESFEGMEGKLKNVGIRRILKRVTKERRVKTTIKKGKEEGGKDNV